MSQSKIQFYRAKLETHPLLVTDTIRDLTDLKTFMEHHVFAVWDFMSLAKALQHRICPSGDVWVPSKLQRSSSRLINDIILAEESDKDMFGTGYISHFDLYRQAMVEIGADIKPINNFVDLVRSSDIETALKLANIPEPSRQFMISTFAVIKTGDVHKIGAAFTYGRETIIPAMFARLRSSLNISRVEAPRFNYYLERHIEVDGEEHGPASEQLMIDLCDHDPIKLVEVEQATLTAIQSRILFWDQVSDQILSS